MVPPLAIERSLVRFNVVAFTVPAVSAPETVRLVVEALPREVWPRIARVPVAVRLPPRNVLPETSRRLDGDVVPMPTLDAVTVSVGVAENPTWKVEAVLLVKLDPRAKALFAVAFTDWPRATEATPVAVKLAPPA